MNKDIRWLQRFSSYTKALKQLEDALALAGERPLSNLEKQGLIQAFEFTHELAWNSIKDFYAFQGDTGIQGSRDAARLAFQRGLIRDGDTWMDMIQSRNVSSHTYDEQAADRIVSVVRDRYFIAFKDLEAALAKETGAN